MIAEKDRARLAAITSMDEIDNFIHVDLDAMTTIDFESFEMPANIRWSEGEPVVYDEEGGLAIVKVSEAGLAYLLEHAAEVPDEHQDDVRTLAEFVAKNGGAHIYELATF
jgi:hypothetical protein